MSNQQTNDATKEWQVFDPGFDYGTVELRAANVAGVFSAAKIAKLDGTTDVRTANIKGQVGDESFDWSAIDVNGADVRTANLRGQVLGTDGFDWSGVDPQGKTVMKANL